VTITPAQTAVRLREVAAILDTATEDTPLSVRLSLDINKYEPGTVALREQTSRVAAIDALAKLFDLTPKPTKLSASYWEHDAHRTVGGFYLSVATQIDPPRRCACGAECTHPAGTP
jgi:hypothetical protein